MEFKKLAINKKTLFLIFLFFLPLFPVMTTMIPNMSKPSKISVNPSIKISTVPNNVVINEILFDDALAGDDGEYVELFNPTDHIINISL